MTRPCCPACGQFMPLSDDVGVHLTPQQRQIYNVVRRAGRNGLSAADVADLIYAERTDGGPLCAERVIWVQVMLMNKKLRAVGRVIRAPKGRSSIGYVLREV
jgi:hypothetical protein